MREFVSYVLESFRDATGWNRDNGYSDLNQTANELLNFHTPRGLRMTLSSLATSQFATSYNLGSIGVVDGSISYLYSSVPLTTVIARSESMPLPILLRSYHQLQLPGGTTSFLPPSAFPNASPAPAALEAISTPPTPSAPHSPLLENAYLAPAADRLSYLVDEARKLVDKPTLLYGRLYLPRSMMEAYMVKRLAPSVQLQLRTVSDSKLPNGGTMLGIVQYDQGKYGLEGLASSDGGLLGVRGLYNFGNGDSLPSSPNAPAIAVEEAPAEEREQQRLHGGRFSAGGEIYYGTLNKSGGISVGARFATLAGHRGTPLTATMTINPLMGNISATYAVVAREYCSLATKFGFNVYSYESEWAVGMELWSKRRLAGLVAVDLEQVEKPPAPPEPEKPEPPKIWERSFQAKLEWRLDDPVLKPEPELKPKKEPRAAEAEKAAPKSSDDEYQGVLKARLDQNLKMGILWEGRIKSLLFSLGSTVDLNRLDQPFRTLGLEIQFSS